MCERSRCLFLFDLFDLKTYHVQILLLHFALV